jgi:nuclear RNA export factor
MISNAYDYLDSQLAARISTSARATASDPLAIRGAARPTVAGRLRRKGTEPISLSRQSGTVDAWRQMVNTRYNSEARFLNLDVRISLHAFFILLSFIENAVDDR